MKNKQDAIYAQEPMAPEAAAPRALAPRPIASEAFALREFDELYVEDEELFAWVDHLLGGNASGVHSTPCTQQPALHRQSLPSAAQPLTQSRSTAQPAITERQMRALSRKHLLLMLRDLEQELLQVTRERDNMLMACRAGMAHAPQAYRAGRSYAK